MWKCALNKSKWGATNLWALNLRHASPANILWDTLPPSGHKGNCQDLEAPSQQCLGVLGSPTAWQAAKSSLVQFSPVMSDSVRPHGLQHARPPCPSPTPGVYPNSCPSSQWCHPAISSSVVPFSSCPQSLPASGSFPMSQLFAWGGQSIGILASASVFPMNIQDWFPLGWTGWISL